MGNKYSVDNRVVGKGVPRKSSKKTPKPTPPPSPSSSATSETAGKENSAPPQQSQPAQSPSANPLLAKKASKGEDVISNWKLFNDLENREEADVLNLSVFLDALTRYFPGLDKDTAGASELDGGATPPPPADALALGKTVSEQVVGHIDIANMYVHGKELDAVITLANAQDMIESCRNGQKIQRHVLVRVVNEAMALFRREPTLVEFTVAPANHVTVVGDLHGQLDDLLLIFRENGLPSAANPYVFNGDFVDRGDRGVEIAVIIYLFKILYPHHVRVNRGNHEETSITQVFGFMKECELKYDRFVFELFCESFRHLPLATLLDGRVLVVHGGVGRELIPLRELNALDRAGYDLTRWREKPKTRADREPHRQMTVMRDLLWSDPKASKGWEENKRGAGINYGPDVVQKFMTKNKLALIVRSHECVPRGFDWPYQDQGMLVTLFSASNYCGKANNLGCFMRIPSDRQAKPAFFQYMASAEARDMGVANLDALFSLIVEHRDDLLEAFVAQDTAAPANALTVGEWGRVMEDVLDLSLDWKALQPLLTALDADGFVPYNDFLARYNAAGGMRDSDVSDAAAGDDADADDDGAAAAARDARLKRRAAFNALYRHRSRLEALFRVLDRDGSGTITTDELDSGIALLNAHLPPGTKSFELTGAELMRTMDFSHDGEININEFMEGFRINAKLTVHAKWKRARKKIKALSAIGALRMLSHAPIDGDDDQEDDALAPADGADRGERPALTRIASGRAPPPVLTRHGSVQVIGAVASAADVAVQLGDDGLATVEDADSDASNDEDEEKEEEEERKPAGPLA
ncbi:hypothetical protein PybrP1_010812 [[Pythium] brassicae (nom. inval.)]|nr:hypothetical protein PybrP1_010812 [[Pythium] brassicae (nom. inval.)]